MMVVKLQLLVGTRLHLAPFRSNLWSARDDGEARFVAGFRTALLACLISLRSAIIEARSEDSLWQEQLITDGGWVLKKSVMKFWSDIVCLERRNRSAV